MTALNRTVRTKGVPMPAVMTRTRLPFSVVVAAAVAPVLPLPLVLLLPTAMVPVTFS